MKRSVALMGTVLVCFALISCNGGKLDRSTAEKLLRSSTAITGQTLTRDHTTQQQVEPNSDHAELESDMGDVAFLDALTDSGLLRKEADKQIPGSSYAPASTREIYTVIPQPGIQVLYPGGFDEDAMYTLAHASVKRVTGISQDGNQATVVADIGWEPTELYKKSIGRIQPLFAKFDCPKGFVNSLGGYTQSYFCTHWPTDQEMKSTHSVQFNFQKFDDGWRLMQDPQ